MAMAESPSGQPEHAAFFAEDAHLFATTVRDNLLVARGDATDDELRMRCGGSALAIGWTRCPTACPRCWSAARRRSPPDSAGGCCWRAR